MIEVVPLDFMGQGALLQPVDEKLHDAAIEYAGRELTKEVSFVKFAKTWVGLKDGKVFGLCGYVLRPDVPLMRSTDADVLRALGHRVNDYLADQGWRKGEAFIYIGHEKPEQRCPEWRRVLCEFGAKSAQRFIVEVK